jgi:hypothetical protein
MKRLAFGVLLAAATMAIAPGNQSSVYACDRSARTDRVRTAIGKTPGVTVVDVVVAGDHAGSRRIEVTSDGRWTCGAAGPGEKAATAHALRRTAQVAATLGRALATALGAVVGSLVDAAGA